MEILDAFAILTAAGLSTLGALLWVLPRASRQAMRPVDANDPAEPSVSFLFENEELHHLSGMAAKLYQLAPGRNDWADTRERLQNRFPEIPERACEISVGQTTLAARDIEDSASLSVTRKGDFTTVTLCQGDYAPAAQAQRYKAIKRELEDLRRASDTTSHAIWQVDAEGTVTWYNAAYKDLYKKLHGSEPVDTR
ncbi:MAG: hypothetical protein PVI41_09670, partial [Roseobacter sp.]